MTLTEELQAKDAAKAVAIADQKAAALAEYNQIIRREASPQPGDSDRLEAVLSILGLTRGDYASDLAILKRDDQISRSLHTPEQLQAIIVESEKKLPAIYATAQEFWKNALARLSIRDQAWGFESFLLRVGHNLPGWSYATLHEYAAAAESWQTALHDAQTGRLDMYRQSDQYQLRIKNPRLWPESHTADVSLKSER